MRSDIISSLALKRMCYILLRTWTEWWLNIRRGEYEISARATTSEARKRKKQRKKGKKRKLEACENRRKRACRVFRSLGGAPLAKGIGILQLETVDCETLHLFTLTADKACLRAPRGRGELGYERDGDACRKCWIKPLKETSLGVAPTYFWPLKETILNFDYMNRVNKTN